MTIQINNNIYSNQPNVSLKKDNGAKLNSFIPCLKDLTFLKAALENKIKTIPPLLIANSVESLGLSHLFNGYDQEQDFVPEKYALGFRNFATEYCAIKKRPAHYMKADKDGQFIRYVEDKKVYLSALVQGLQNSSMIPNDYQMRQLLTHMLDPKVRRLVQNAIRLWIGYLLNNMRELNSSSNESNEGAIAVNGLKSFLALLGVGKGDVVLINANWIVQNAETWSDIYSKGLKLPKNIKMFNGLNILQIALIMEKTDLANQIIEAGGYESCKITKIRNLYHTSPVNLATLIGNFDLTKKILDVNAKNNNSINEILKSRFNCPLHIAASTGDKDIMEKLLELDINVNAQGVDTRTPLYLAVIHGHYGVVELLLKNKGSAKAGKPWEIALQNDDYKLLDLLHKHGGIPKIADTYIYQRALRIPHLTRLKILEKYDLVPPSMNVLTDLYLRWPPITDKNKQMFIDLIEHLEAHNFDCFEIALSNNRNDFCDLLIEERKEMSQYTVNKVFYNLIRNGNFKQGLLGINTLFEIGHKPNEELYPKLLQYAQKALNFVHHIYQTNVVQNEIIQAAQSIMKHVAKRKRNQPSQVTNEMSVTETSNQPNKKQKLN